jgi:predicted AlkP superfamily pyrophosphatase or phosphodiesterase
MRRYAGMTDGVDCTMRLLACLIAGLAGLFASHALADPVLMISIDGLRPADVLQAEARGLKIPNLRAIARDGAYATAVRGVLPTLTYPSHTTLITGVWPDKHGIASNLTFDPYVKNQTGWYWYAEDIKVPTLWDAAHGAGLKVANVHWPVSVGARAVDLNLPQLWRTGTDDDRKLNRALATRGLTERLEAALGPYAQGIDESVEGDENRARFAEKLMTDEAPGFTTVYLTGLDHVQHERGPDTPEAHAALERIDAAVGRLVTAARKLQPRLVVVIVSDHGFAPVAHDVNLLAPFVQAGLIRVDLAKREITSWEAEPWFAGGAAAVKLARPEDKALRARVEALLDKLKADPQLGIDEVMDGARITKLGGAHDYQYLIGFKLGYEMGKDPVAAPVTPSPVKGMHGYAPTFPEMRATFLVSGPSLKAHGSLGEIDMRDIAPTVARLMGAGLPTADGKPLF